MYQEKKNVLEERRVDHLISRQIQQHHHAKVLFTPAVNLITRLNQDDLV